MENKYGALSNITGTMSSLFSLMYFLRSAIVQVNVEEFTDHGSSKLKQLLRTVITTLVLTSGEAPKTRIKQLLFKLP